MKVLYQDYSFDALNKQITFTGTDTIELANVLLITNVSVNTIIYNFANPAAGGSMAGNVLTLDYDTTSMNNTDSLQIFLDIYGSSASEATLEALNNQIALMKRLLVLLNPIATQDSLNRQRVVVENTAVIVTQSTASSLNTNTGLIAGIDPRFQFLDAARLTYAAGIRRNLISS